MFVFYLSEDGDMIQPVFGCETPRTGSEPATLETLIQLYGLEKQICVLGVLVRGSGLAGVGEDVPPPSSAYTRAAS